MTAMPHVLATTAALAIAFATVPTPKPTPFAIGTLQPFGTETPAPAAALPEIGAGTAPWVPPEPASPTMTG